jgi:hypothetical protein
MVTNKGEYQMDEVKKKSKPVPAVYKPFAPDNIRISKAEFIKRQREIKEKNAMLKAYKDKLDSGEVAIDKEVVKEPEPVAPVVAKPRGRPKMIK